MDNDGITLGMWFEMQERDWPLFKKISDEEFLQIIYEQVRNYIQEGQ